MTFILTGVTLLASLFTAHAPAHQHPKPHQPRRHRHHRAHPHYSYAIASVYDAAGGPLACAGDSYGPVVANKTLPCGTRLTICYRGCTRAVVLDRGPYVGGRDFDLSRLVESRIGFPYGVGQVHYHYGWR